MSWELIILVAAVVAIAGVRALTALVADEYDLQLRLRRAQNALRQRQEIRRRHKARYNALLGDSEVEESAPSE